jgi:serine protease
MFCVARRFGVLLSLFIFAPAAIPDSIAQTPPSAYGFRFDPARFDAYLRAFREALPYVPGEVLVRFRESTSEEGRARALTALRGARQGAIRIEWVGDLAVVRAPAEQDAEQAAALLRLQPEVEYAQPNYLLRIESEPNDSGFSRQWNMQALEMPRAWDINPGAADTVVVAIIDSGVTTTDSAFAFRLWTGEAFETASLRFARNPDLSPTYADPRDFVFWDGPVLDMIGHGTHIAGTIAQLTNNGIGFAGMAYNARIMPLKVCFGYWELQLYMSSQGEPGFVDPRIGGGCPTSATVEAIRYAADHGAKVINLSLGGPGASPAELDALRYAADRGAFVAIAVGNEYEEGNPVEYPAAYGADVNGVVAVGAVGRSLRRAFYSNTGAHLELVAPGGDIRDGGFPGLIYQTGLFGGDFDPFTVIVPRFDRYHEEPNMGTSMAAPHVAGLAALLVSQGITDPAAVEAAMKRFARDLGVAGEDPEYGAGLIDPRRTLRGLGIAK